MNLDADRRALRRAQNAETQRKRRANCVSLNEENDQCRARRVLPGVRAHESAQRAAAREEPGVREHESAQRAATREDGTRRDEENNQRRVRRNETGVREYESAQRAAAREETAVRERERRQRARRTLDMGCKYQIYTYFYSKGIQTFVFLFRHLGQSNRTWAIDGRYSGILIHSWMHLSQTRPGLERRYFLLQWSRYRVPVRSVKCERGGGIIKMACLFWNKKGCR